MTSTPAPAHRLPIGIALGGAVLVGVLTALQSRINGSLGAGMGDGLAAALVSFGSGLLILLALSVILPAGRRGLGALARGVRRREIPPWMLCGGFAGAFTVASQGLTVATIGVALFTVGFVAGQTVHGIVLDRVGYGPAGVVPVTVPRLVGGMIVIAAVALSLSGGGIAQVPWWMLVMPFLAGAGVAWQQGTNGRLRQKLGTPLTATLVNFIGGTLALGVAVLIHVLKDGPRILVPGDGWLYLGGALGVTYIFLSAALVRHTGVLLLGLGSVVGLLGTSILLDAAWPPPSGPSLVVALIAVLVATVGAITAVVPWRRRRTR